MARFSEVCRDTAKAIDSTGGLDKFEQAVSQACDDFDTSKDDNKVGTLVSAVTSAIPSSLPAVMTTFAQAFGSELSYRGPAWKSMLASVLRRHFNLNDGE